VAQAIELLRPGRRGGDVLRVDAVDLDVPLLELVVACGRSDQPPGSGDHFTASNAHEPDGAGRRGAGVRCFEVDRGEIQWHLSTLSPVSGRPGQARRRLAT